MFKIFLRMCKDMSNCRQFKINKYFLFIWVGTKFSSERYAAQYAVSVTHDTCGTCFWNFYVLIYIYIIFLFFFPARARKEIIKTGVTGVMCHTFAAIASCSTSVLNKSKIAIYHTSITSPFISPRFEHYLTTTSIIPPRSL